MSEMNPLFVNPNPQPVDMESVKHQYLTDDNGRQLLQQLQEIVAACMPQQEIMDTLRNYHIEMMLSCVLVSGQQYQTLHAIVEKAKQSLKKYFGETAACRNAITAEVYVKRVEVVDACSYALPGQPGHPPIIVINSSLIELMKEDELQAVILHELGHILYTSSEYIQSMKILLDILSDGSIVRSFQADTQTAKFNQLLVGFELTADRVMKICMPDRWNAIQSMFAKLAGGLKTMEVDANEFVQQYEKLDQLQAEQLSLVSQTKREHPPVLYRLILLRRYELPSGAYVAHG
jgi:Zn-dependent protease with chaperone function